MTYRNQAKELVRNLNQRMGPSPYDIAWMTRLQSSVFGEIIHNDWVEWLLQNQHPDGSWGGQILYYHDRIICTLAAVMALHQSDHTERSKIAIENGSYYLWHHMHLLPKDTFELVGFELIFPALLDEAYSLGLDLPTHACGYRTIQTEKLRLIPPDMLYSPQASIVHSLEFLGAAADASRLEQALTCNGSLGNSPAATAYYLLYHGAGNKRALNYLTEVREHQKDIIYLYPFRTFELTWVLNNLAFAGLPITNFVEKPVLDRLRAELGDTGVGLDPTFGIPDGDITAVCSYLLLRAGYDIPSNILARFEDKQHAFFCTYEYERNPSAGTNIHALAALKLMLDYKNYEETRDNIVVTLLSMRRYNIYWVDKWHTSPYYATAHALVGLLKEGSHIMHICRETVDWLVHTQRKDGSWGFFQVGTAEETAYVLTALLHYYRRYRIFPRDVLDRGAAYLARTYLGENHMYPELWIGKCLYTPQDIVRAANLAALILYEQTFATSPG